MSLYLEPSCPLPVAIPRHPMLPLYSQFPALLCPPVSADLPTALLKLSYFLPNSHKRSPNLHRSSVRTNVINRGHHSEHICGHRFVFRNSTKQLRGGTRISPPRAAVTAWLSPPSLRCDHQPSQLPPRKSGLTARAPAQEPGIHPRGQQSRWTSIRSCCCRWKQSHSSTACLLALADLFTYLHAAHSVRKLFQLNYSISIYHNESVCLLGLSGLHKDTPWEQSWGSTGMGASSQGRGEDTATPPAAATTCLRAIL